MSATGCEGLTWAGRLLGRQCRSQPDEFRVIHEKHKNGDAANRAQGQYFAAVPLKMDVPVVSARMEQPRQCSGFGIDAWLGLGPCSGCSECRQEPDGRDCLPLLFGYDVVEMEGRGM